MRHSVSSSGPCQRFDNNVLVAGNSDSMLRMLNELNVSILRHFKSLGVRGQL